MGLDVSHGCWHGAYSAFMRWRQEIARVAGYPPLMLMDGFYRDDAQLLMGLGVTVHEAMKAIERPSTERYMAGFLPIPWTHFERDPLSKLLHHSDCDGEIAAGDCAPIANRLEELLPLLPQADDHGHIGNWRDKTSQFIDGLRAAAVAGEAVEFG